MRQPGATTIPEPPVIVVGPTTRCGTSLLQRALNSTRKIVVYGENFTFMHKYPDMLRGLDRNLEGKRRNIGISRKMLLSGEDFEGSSLFPDYDRYIASVRQGFMAIARMYRDDAEALGFSRWGIKHQIRDQHSFDIVPKLLPRARFIFIYRELLAVARSAKARWPGDFRGPDDYRRFGENWARNIRTAQQLASDRFMIVRYEEFVGDPEPHLAKIEKLTGIDGIDRSVMTRRINANPLTDRDVRGQDANAYRPPSDLTDDEVGLLMRDARSTYDALNYEAQPAGKRGRRSATA